MTGYDPKRPRLVTGDDEPAPVEAMLEPEVPEPPAPTDAPVEPAPERHLRPVPAGSSDVPVAGRPAEPTANRAVVAVVATVAGAAALLALIVLLRRRRRSSSD